MQTRRPYAIALLPRRVWIGFVLVLVLLGGFWHASDPAEDRLPEHPAHAQTLPTPPPIDAQCLALASPDPRPLPQVAAAPEATAAPRIALPPSKPDRRTTAPRARVAQPAAADLVQYGGGALFGVVVLPDGTPALDAEISIAPLDADSRANVNALRYADLDEDGEFFIDGLPDDDYRLFIEVPAQPSDASVFAPVIEDIALRAEEELDLGLFELELAAQIIRGQVLLDATQPVTDAQVLVYEREYFDLLTAETDANGQFVLGVIAGDWEVLVATPSDQGYGFFEPSVLEIFDESPRTATVQLNVQTPDTILTAQILRPDGSPLTVPDVYAVDNLAIAVDLVNQATDVFSFGFAQADGSIRIPLLFGTYDAWLWVERESYPDFAGVTLGSISVVSDTLDLGGLRVAARTSQLTGRVLTPAGQPVPDVELDVWQDDGFWEVTESDASGVYTATLPAGEWLVEPYLTGENGLLAVAGARAVSVPSDTVISDIDFTLTPVRATLQGRVQDQAGTLLERLPAFAYARFVTDSTQISFAPVISGTFALPVPAGEVQVGVLSFAEPAPYLPTREATPDPNDAVTVVLVAANGQVQGTLRDPDGSAVTGISGRVFATAADGRLIWQGAPIVAATGTYTLPLAPGTWSLNYILRTTQYQATATVPLSVTIQPNDRLTRDLDLTALAGEVRGRVQDPQGNPRADTVVWVQQGDQRQTVRTDANGQFRALVARAISPTVQVGTLSRACLPLGDGNPPPNCLRDADVVSVSPRPRAVPALAQMANVAADVDEVVLILRPSTAVLVGQVFMAAGQPAPASFVAAYSSDAQNADTRSDQRGCFVLPIVYDPDQDAVLWQVVARAVDPATQTWRRSAVATISTATLTPTHQTATPAAALSWAQLQLALVLGQNAEPLRPPVMVRFAVAQGWSGTLADGTLIRIPPNAIQTREATVQLAIHPRFDLPHTHLYRVLGLGYELTLFGGTSGRPLAAQLLRDMLLIMPVPDEPAQQGQLAQTILPPASDALLARYAEQVWQVQSDSSYNAIAGTLTLQTRTLGTWAVLAPHRSMPDPPPLEPPPDSRPTVYLPFVVRL